MKLSHVLQGYKVDEYNQSLNMLRYEYKAQIIDSWLLNTSWSNPFLVFKYFTNKLDKQNI